MRTVARRSSVIMFVFAAACDGNAIAPVLVPPAPEVKPGLWTASGSPSAIQRLGPEQLLTDGTPTPATTITTPSARLFTLNSIAFDADGTMWVASQDDS
ncbi:MAG TPA: hypothetical protein VFT21_07670, partial [Gemmatimonadaceae bacterium]|nr:hypothetical protein [Gemmatimonadaceae bacterium]